MRKPYEKAAFGLACSVAAMLIASAALATDISGHRVVDGLDVYFGVVPARVLREFPKDSQEAAMHRFIPMGKRKHHMLVSLFESDDMQRVTDAQVTVRIREPGFGWTTKHLYPTTLNGNLTYCNYFTFYDNTNYMIGIDVLRRDMPEMITAEFSYSNQ
jgi:hypothetical protein